MSLIAAAKPAWEEIKSLIQGAAKRAGPLKGVTFYEGPVVAVNLRFPAIVVTERAIAPVDQTFLWGVAQLRVRLEAISGIADPEKNLDELETLADSLLGLFWNNRQLNCKARDTKVEDVTIGQVEEKPEHISATLVLVFDIEFHRPM